MRIACVTDKPDTVSPYMKQLMDERKQEQTKTATEVAGKVDIHAEFGKSCRVLDNSEHHYSHDVYGTNT